MHDPASAPDLSAVLTLPQEEFDKIATALRDGIEDLIATAANYDHMAFTSVSSAILNLVRSYKEANKLPQP